MLKSKRTFVVLSTVIFGGGLFVFFILYSWICDPPIRVTEVIVLGVACGVGGWIWAELMWHMFVNAGLKRIKQTEVQPESENE